MALNVVPRTRFQLLFLVCLLVAGYFAYQGAVVWYEHVGQTSDQRDEAQRKVSALEEKHAYLQAVYDYVQTDEFIEQQARRELGYVRDGEIPFVVTSPPPDQPRIVAGDWWERLFPR